MLQPTILVDFSDPAARRQMISGWSSPPRKTETEKRAWVWSYDVAELEFLVERVGDLEVALRVAPTGAVRSPWGGACWRRCAASCSEAPV